MSVSTTITVYHGTGNDFIDAHFAIGQVSAIDNPPAFCGFWVSESRATAEAFIHPTGERPRVLVFEMDTTNAIWSRDDHGNLTEEEL